VALPGDGTACTRERLGGALVQVGELGDAHHSSAAGERLGQHRAVIFPALSIAHLGSG